MPSKNKGEAIAALTRLLNKFHLNKQEVEHLDILSSIAGGQFPGEFNVSGFHETIRNLPDRPREVWGIDRCMRIQDEADSSHSHLFHMGIYAKSIQLKGDYRNPFDDDRFRTLQLEVLEQFFVLLELLNLDREYLECTYCAGCTVGGRTAGRDRLLSKAYQLAEDSASLLFLRKKGIKAYPVYSLANVDIRPEQGALVGPRIEMAYKGVEIATVVFDCFRLSKRVLVPMNYLAGYALGIERLEMACSGSDSLMALPKYKRATESLHKAAEAARSVLFSRESTRIVMAAEVTSAIANEELGKGQKELVRRLKMAAKKDCQEIGLASEAFCDLVNDFTK